MSGISESLGKEANIVTDTHIKLPQKAFFKLESKVGSQKHRTTVKHYFITAFPPQAPLLLFLSLPSRTRGKSMN